ncbi:DUF6542 domain-containing protein [Streptomyces sp. NPDC050263]|uniref:DUF6542 domain-containing protein n=1 Tax=Streptomyces sp. NPDC050263 TaxID=3155037 RepID=UPI00343A445A
MEQHWTRPPSRGATRRDPLPPLPSVPSVPPLPPQGGGREERGRERQPRPAAPRSGPAPVRPLVLLAGRRVPNPRLTGLGAGLFSAALMFLLGCLDQLLFGASLTVYSVLFLPACLLTGLWVRGGDLLSAPVVVPIAFAVGLLPVAEGGHGFGARLMGLVTALATQVGWLYGGTLLAALTILARGLRRAAARRQAARARPRH